MKRFWKPHWNLQDILNILALLLVLAAITEARAQGAGGVLLVASPKMGDGWAQTVLVATPVPSGHHVGVIINKPTDQSLSSLFPSHEPSRKVVEPVYFGGPFHSGTLVALVKGQPEEGKGALKLAENVYLALAGDSIDRVIEQDPQSARYFVGIVVWQPGELQEELKAGAWSPRKLNESDLFSEEPGGLWKRLTPGAIGPSASAAQRLLTSTPAQASHTFTTSE